MNDWRERLKRLERLLKQTDPRTDISAYHDMPCAIFRYNPEDEFPFREELSLLQTRLSAAGKTVTRISLAKCLTEALEREGMSADRMAMAERSAGVGKIIDQIHKVLSDYCPLDELVAEHFPSDGDPTEDLIFITRAGALFPAYRTSALLEQLMGTVELPAVLFYPGRLEGAAGLKFMGITDAEHNYRPKIF
ncbi:MAG: BREX protein BrxB domain-containing protein [Candidatus Brocadiia bacterium]